jgi:thymidylate synthase
VFGAQFKFDLQNSFPLLTTKRIFWKGVVEELLWFISGSTDASILQNKGVNIWNKNADSFYKTGLFEKNDLGPIYGFQWRHYGEQYIGKNKNYKGVDQLKEIIKTIQTKPWDRRMIITAWNPCDIQNMALPPCHCMIHFDVSSPKDDGTQKLSCHLFQRSADMGLGVPFNIASYALLTHIIAHAASTIEQKIVPGNFVHTLSNVHIYNNHINALKIQLAREPKKFPKLVIKTKNKDIDKFIFEDFELIEYDPHPSIKMEMVT